jgi:hypothetical protein
MNKLKIRFYKWRLRRNHNEFMALLADYNCGVSMFLQMSKRGDQLAARIDADLDRLAALGDANVPEGRYTK